jgi:serine/threonine-protein kinase RsbW
MAGRRKAGSASTRKPKRARATKAPASHLTMHAEAWQPAGEVVFTRSWPSRLDAKQEALDTLAELMVSRGWVGAEDRSWLALCLDEAVTNAMLHGNEGDPRLAVDVTVALDATRWWMALSDQGQGFTPESVPDPEDPASLLLEHGRGIRLMRSWLESLTYWRNGATIVLCRRRSDTGTPP